MKKYYPTPGRVITLQKKENKTQSGILIAESAVTKNRIAEVVAVNESDDVRIGSQVFFDFSAGSIIEDTDEGVYTVIDIDDILAYVEEV